jgi:carbonic anhydrase
MEYAVENLGSRVLLVLGHEKCGAVAEAVSGERMPSENLEAIVKKIRPGVDHLKNLVTGETLNSLAVEANVHHSAADTIENSPIIRHAVASGDLAVFKAVYKVNTGEVFAINRSHEPKP